MDKLLALTCVAAFLALASYSYPTPQGYTTAQIDALNRLAEQSSLSTLKQRQAPALADLWSISEDDIAKPVELWGGK